jgi:hypothetical protein
VCEPLNKLGNITLNPCGFIANTLFNDVFTLANTEFLMQEKGIAWASDLEYMFAQPEGFQAEPCPNGDCSAACCEGDEWSCEVPYQNKEDEQCYRYFYPNDNTTQYLYEVSPNACLIYYCCLQKSVVSRIFLALDVSTSCKSIGGSHQ